jgi:hypothetical protein
LLEKIQIMSNGVFLVGIQIFMLSKFLKLLNLSRRHLLILLKLVDVVTIAIKDFFFSGIPALLELPVCH